MREKILKLYENSYDEKTGLLVEYRSGNGYHSTLSDVYVHTVFKSLSYALLMLESGESRYMPRVEKILSAVIAEQDKDKGSITYGLMPYYLEEPIQKMDPPDFNMADFSAKALLKMLLKENGRLSGKIKDEMRMFIDRACSLIIARDCGADYTNISLMGTFCTLVFGEMFGEKQIFEYGKARLQKLYAYNMSKNSFDEYNSPAYTIIALEEISDMLSFVKDKECLKMLSGLNMSGWECVALHYHRASGQWAGPYTRAYSSLTAAETLQKIDDSLGGRVRLQIYGGFDGLPISDQTKMHCPKCFDKYFKKDFTREYFCEYLHYESEVYGKGSAYTYFTADYALGSFEKDMMWNQKRNIIAHYLSGGKPACMYVRFLKDGADFAGASITTAHSKNKLASVVGLVTDGGDKHCILDKPGGSFTASDLRLRISILDNPDNCTVVKTKENALAVKSGGLVFNFDFPCGGIDGSLPKLIAGSEKNALINQTGTKLEYSDAVFVDLVLYSGENKIFKIAEIEQFYAAFTLEIAKNQVKTAAKYQIKDKQINIKYGNLEVNCSVAPRSIDSFYADGYIKKGGKRKGFTLGRSVYEVPFSGSYDFYYKLLNQKKSAEAAK